MALDPLEIIVIAIVIIVILIFGSKKIPELARALGSAKREYEKGKEGSGETK